MVDFDHEAIERYGITAQDVENAQGYIAILRRTDSQTYVPERTIAGARAIRETKDVDG